MTIPFRIPKINWTPRRRSALIFLAAGSITLLHAAPSETTPNFLDPRPDFTIPLTSPAPPSGYPAEVYAKEHFQRVSRPALYLYVPSDGKTLHPAVVICPGGGYGSLAYGSQVNQWIPFFHEKGFVVIGLKYRLSARGLPALRTAAAEDIRQALVEIDKHAEDWEIDRHRVGLLGSSAGANAILNYLSSVATHPKSGLPSANAPWFAALLSPWPAQQSPEEFTFSAQTPPLFIASAQDDQTAPVTFAEAIAKQARSDGAAVLLDVIATGGHSAFRFGASQPGGNWPPPFFEWLGKFPAVKN